MTDSIYYLTNGKADSSELTAIVTGENTIDMRDESLQFEEIKISNDLIFLRINSKNYTVKLEENTATGFKMFINGDTYEVNCMNDLDKIKEKFGMTSGDEDEQLELRSPMPGAVVKINIKEGDVVSKGDTLIVLEAMKMENELKAQIDATVSKIHVNEKDAVEKNHLLIELSK